MYHSANAKETMYGHGWRLWTLALVGRLLGIQFKVGGMPFGAPFNRERFDRFYGHTSGVCGSSQT